VEEYFMQITLLKRVISLIIIILFLGMSIYPAQVNSKIIVTKNDQAEEIFFGLKSHVDVTWDENATLELVVPNSGVLILPLNISYWVTWGIFGRLTNCYLNHLYFQVNIKLEIIDKPEWCDVSIDNPIISMKIPTKQNIKYLGYSNLKVTVTEKAPAFEKFPITIQATMDRELKGPFGFITLLSPATITKNVTLIAGYWVPMGYYFPEGIEIETPPLIEKQLPIIAHNFGNGKTLLECKIIESPTGFLVYFDPENLILEVGEENTTYLKITAPSNFSGRETIITSFTPHYYYNYSIMDHTENISINVFYYP
jgi:hypothetical protein